MRTLTFFTLIAFMVACSALAAPPPAFNNNLTPIVVDGSTLASGFAVSVIYDNGIFHLWYRTTTGDITGMHHATSTNGVNFTTTGTLSFTPGSFPTVNPPLIFYENVAKVGADYKIFHWTQNGDAGGFPDYNYNISVSSIGPDANNLVVTHQGPITPASMALVGFSAGPFGSVNGLLFCQSDTGQKFCHAQYNDGAPPSIGPQAANVDLTAFFASIGDAAGYINNHSDVIQVANDLGIFFTVRDGAGNRFNKQVYYSTSTDGGTTWSNPVGLFTAPTVSGLPASGNFAHADAVMATTTIRLYLSTLDAAGNFIIATTSVDLFPTAYQVAYAANLAAGDSYVNLTNNGTLNGFDPDGRICANVYTFDPSEELISCCSCPVTPDGLKSLSVKQDLVANHLTPAVPGSVVIKLVASAPIGGLCNASAPTFGTLTSGLRAWGTSFHLNTQSGLFNVTENVFQSSPLSDSELAKMTSFCGFIQANASGFGICGSCKLGGLGGARQ
jgi:hypothetical protein